MPYIIHHLLTLHRLNIHFSHMRINIRQFLHPLIIIRLFSFFLFLLCNRFLLCLFLFQEIIDISSMLILPFLQFCLFAFNAFLSPLIIPLIFICPLLSYIPACITNVKDPIYKMACLCGLV